MSNTFSPDFKSRGSSGSDRDLTLPSGSSIVVVGAGAFGGWSALQLQRAGFQVTLVDGRGPGNSLSSSGGESRLIRCIYGANPFYTSLAKRAIEIWEEEQSQFRKQVFFKTGCLWFANEGSSNILNSAKQMLRKLDLSFQVLSDTACSEKFPHINVSDLSELIYEEYAGYLLAREACVEVRNRFVAEGGTFVAAHAEIKGKRGNGISNIQLSDGTSLDSDFFLFACGPWMKALFPDVLQSRLKISRQEVYYFAVPTGSEELTRYPTWIDHSPPDHYYGVPGGIGRGFKIAFDRRGVEVDPNTQERTPSAEEIEHARSYIGDRFPIMQGAPLVEARVCQYSNTEDANFIFDRHPELQNVLLLGGGSGHGYKHGPALGELVKEVVTGSKPLPIDLVLR